VTTSVLSVGLNAVVLAGCASTDDGSQRRPTPSASASASAQQMVHLLESVLPEGELSGQRGNGVVRGDKPGPPPSAELVFGDGPRAAKVTVKLNRYPVPVPALLSQCPSTAYYPYSRCTQKTLPGGAWLVADESPQEVDKSSGAKVYSALLTFDDGRQVAVFESGSPNGRATTKDSALPLSLDQVSAIATSQVWRPVFSAMTAPRSGDPGAGSTPRMSGAQISGTIEQLLPPGLPASNKGGSEGFGYVVVDDGRGKSLVAVNVQRWQTDDPDMTNLFRKADTLPDGTRVSITKGAPDDGGERAIEWCVDTFRTDGLRVAISALNAPAYPLSATREEPALTTRQLQQIALDPAWRRASR
jgi:hypothetical protein